MQTLATNKPKVRGLMTLPSERRAQVCIIGSGPAGITAAYELSKNNIDVILPEGSRQLNYTAPSYKEESWSDKAKLYEGLSDGVFKSNEINFIFTRYN